MLERCRTCLIEVPDTSYIVLNKKDATTESIRAQLSACEPELQLDVVEDPVICHNCVNSLQLAYSFKTRCVLTEERIRSCLRNTKLNGKRVTLTKLFSFSMETDTGSSCSEINDFMARKLEDRSTNIAAGECFLSEPDIQVQSDNDEQERTKVYITSTSNQDSDVVMNSSVSIVDSEEESKLQGCVRNGGAIVELTVEPRKPPENILGSLRVDTCFVSTDEILQDLHDTIDDNVVKEKYDLLTIKKEADEALNLKQEDLDDEKERSNSCAVKEETSQSVTYYTGGVDLIDEKNKFWVSTGDDEHFDVNKSTNLHNQTEESYVSDQRFCIDMNYSCESYIDSTASSDATANANITEPTVPSANHEKERTYNYNNLINKSSFNVDEFLNAASGKPLQNTTKKPKNVRERSRTLSETERAHSPKKSLRCDLCEFSTAIKQHLVAHIRTHTGEKPFHCNICEFRVARKWDLIRHMQIHTGEKPFRCNLCDLKFARKEHLIKHKRIHTGEKPFRCTFCDFKAGRKSNLITHLRIHNGEKPFCCNICGLRLAQREHLASHMLTHTGDNPFRCNVCEFKGAKKSYLIKHMRIHIGEKPFHCNICNLSMNQKQQLVSHMRMHSEEKLFRCNVCGTSMARKRNLIVHMRTHTGEKPFRCNVCEYVTSWKGNLTRHMKKHN